MVSFFLGAFPLAWDISFQLSSSVPFHRVTSVIGCTWPEALCRTPLVMALLRIVCPLETVSCVPA